MIRKLGGIDTGSWKLLHIGYCITVCLCLLFFFIIIIHRVFPPSGFSGNQASKSAYIFHSPLSQFVPLLFAPLCDISECSLTLMFISYRSVFVVISSFTSSHNAAWFYIAESCMILLQQHLMLCYHTTVGVCLPFYCV